MGSDRPLQAPPPNTIALGVWFQCRSFVGTRSVHSDISARFSRGPFLQEAWEMPFTNPSRVQPSRPLGGWWMPLDFERHLSFNG